MLKLQLGFYIKKMVNLQFDLKYRENNLHVTFPVDVFACELNGLRVITSFFVPASFW